MWVGWLKEQVGDVWTLVGIGPTNASPWHSCLEDTQGSCPLWHFPNQPLGVGWGPTCPTSFNDPAWGRQGQGWCKGQLLQSTQQVGKPSLPRGHCSKRRTVWLSQARLHVPWASNLHLGGGQGVFEGSVPQFPQGSLEGSGCYSRKKS